MRIGVVAPSTPVDRAVAEQVAALAAEAFPGTQIVFHPQCFESWRHFAGEDSVRAEAFLAVANDPRFDALWFARGGYGSCRIAEDVLSRLGPAAREKSYLGYSDAGYLLAGLYGAGFATVAHGPLPQDVKREGGEAAVHRSLSWLVARPTGALAPRVDAHTRHAALQITVFRAFTADPNLPHHAAPSM